MRQLLAYAVQAAATGEVTVNPERGHIGITVSNGNEGRFMFNVRHESGKIWLFEPNMTYMVFDTFRAGVPYKDFLGYIETILNSAGQPSVAELFASVEPVEEKENV